MTNIVVILLDKIDADSILRTISNISKVDELLTSMITLWQNVGAQVMLLKDTCDTFSLLQDYPDKKQEMRNQLATLEHVSLLKQSMSSWMLHKFE